MFHELDPPHRSFSSPKFYVCTVDEVDGEFLFLRNNGSLDAGDGDMHLYLFDTKVEAHEAALIYYHGHCVTYAHNDELLALKNINENNTTDTGESQVMEFI